VSELFSIGLVVGSKHNYCNNRKASISFILDQLGWPSLCDKRPKTLLGIFGKAIAAGRVAVNTINDLVQPSRQTSYSDPDLTYTTQAAHTDVYKYLFFSKQYVIGTP